MMKSVAEGCMKHIKKNNALLIGSIQSAGYVLKLIDRADLAVNSMQKKQLRQMINQELTAMKREIRKLKRV